MKNLWFHFGCVALAVLVSSSAWACKSVVLLDPAPGSEVADMQPELVWHGSANDSFRVQLTAIVPETRVLFLLDTITQANRFKLPQAIPSRLAAVKVRISQGCSDSDVQDLHAQGPAFFVDARASCRLPEGAIRQVNHTLVWPQLANASGYDVRLFEVDGTFEGAVRSSLVAAFRTPDSRWAVPVSTAANGPPSGAGSRLSRVVTVQAVCGGLAGPAEAVSLTQRD